ncbi:hypothetical protein [Escherichia coli]
MMQMTLLIEDDERITPGTVSVQKKPRFLVAC